ncbi:MAG TPA: hypothetical protein VFS43_18925 [Polyangiaceae bacterium]|nr:hypothetical protein [Polyangiaceae bacterium]
MNGIDAAPDASGWGGRTPRELRHELETLADEVLQAYTGRAADDVVRLAAGPLIARLALYFRDELGLEPERAVDLAGGFGLCVSPDSGRVNVAVADALRAYFDADAALARDLRRPDRPLEHVPYRLVWPGA